MLHLKNITTLYFSAIVVLMSMVTTPRSAMAQNALSAEAYRPQVHFTPQEKWMNDPNGLVYYKGTYHLFYQYYPDGTQWGPMHWGHATSKDLFHWQHQPVALYPDSLGYIFSGSAVVDSNNTSGLGKNGKAPIVAIFTHHNAKLEKQGANAQSQSLAYSLDDGKTWSKYANNPVLPNPGISDFRDPKVSWYEKDKKWIMTLATKDRVTFYSSPNLIKWTKESEFGADLGAHGGVWECPDLFPLSLNGKQHWVLLVSINPGGPNGGSATQYFVGQFDGHRFVPANTATRWIDYGADNYAGVTFSNISNRRIFIGWMSNWLYANNVPTQKWRGATTLPRELQLTDSGNGPVLISKPVSELNNLNIAASTVKLRKIRVKGMMNLNKLNLVAPFRLHLTGSDLKDYTLTFKSKDGHQFVFGYDAAGKKYYTDRSRSGATSFNENFAKVHYAPRISDNQKWQVDIVMDAASAEIFADGGKTSFTEIFFSPQPFKSVVAGSKNLVIDELTYTQLQKAMAR